MTGVERTLLGIGALSRASGLTVSALRFYDGAGLLVPAYVDPLSGYRRYDVEQVRTARVLANLRRVGMPLAEVARVLDAGSPAEAEAVLDRHLRRLETGLADARLVLSRVRTLLDVQEPALSESPAPTSVRLTATDLAAALDRVRFAVSTDPELPALGGILVEVQGAALRLVATDRYRLAVGEAGGRVTEPTASVLVPAAFLDDLRDALTGADAVEVSVQAGGLLVRVDGAEHRTDALELDFPSYRMLLPESQAHRVELDVPGLRSDLPDAPGTVTRLAVDGDRLVVGGDGGDVVLGVDPAFLLQAMAASGTDRLVLELDGPVTPMAIRPAEDDGGFSLLMPVRLDA